MELHKITMKEQDAVRFYQGDTRRRGINGEILDDKVTDGFWSIPKAYQTMNCLMFPGTENEEERIREKKAALRSEILKEADRVIEVYCDIYRAMWKYAVSLERKGHRIVYRTDRGCSVELMKNGYIYSYMSASLKNNPKKYFKEKSALTLLEVIVPEGVPYLDFQWLLGDKNLYPDQEEILLPPFLEINLYKRELSDEEKTWKDMDGQPPKGKYQIIVKEMLTHNPEDPKAKEDTGEELTQERNAEAAAILEKLKLRETLTDQERETYCAWKRDFRRIIWIKFQEIRKEYGQEEQLQEGLNERLRNLKKEVKDLIGDFEVKRNAYKRKMEKHNYMLAVMRTIPILCVSLSFWQPIELVMKILAIVSGVVSILITRKIKTGAYGDKVVQRTKTLMLLRTLERDMEYKSVWNDKILTAYVHRFQKIMDEDTEMSLRNVRSQIESSEELFQYELTD